MIFKFLIGFCLYLGAAYLSYSPTAKASSWIYWVAAGLSMGTGLIWISVARAESVPGRIAILGLYWDGMLTLAYLLMPFLVFNAQLTRAQAAGFILMLAGLFLTKL